MISNLTSRMKNMIRNVHIRTVEVLLSDGAERVLTLQYCSASSRLSYNYINYSIGEMKNLRYILHR